MMAKQRKRISSQEKEFARLIAEAGLGSIQAARKAFGWKCEPKTPESQRARDYARKPRVKAEIEKLRKAKETEVEGKKITIDTETIDLETLRKFAVRRLKEIRDDDCIPAQSRFKAVEALERLADPSKDINLIWRWIDMAVKGASVHCPCCHKDVPAAGLKMPRLEAYRKSVGWTAPPVQFDTLDRRNEILAIADKANKPHSTQRLALNAPERHIMGMGAARSGKSYLIAMFAILYFILPGTECWILAETYDRARSEKEYLEAFFKSLFYPFDKFLAQSRYDSKSGEWTMTSRWGSEMKIKSAKSKGGITAREIDAIFAAEPGWLPDDIFNHVQARLSSRLGRIIALGTPQGLGGFISRIVYATGRDPKTGRVRRLSADERLIENGSPWGVSALVYNMAPTDNPKYVKSELESARQYLSDAEYASEFEGEMVAHAGMMFNAVKQNALRTVHPNELMECAWVLGVDQGAKNFGACLGGYDGNRIYIARDFFEGDFKTIRTNLLHLRAGVPAWIRELSGDPSRWRLSIFDQEPGLHGTFAEMEAEFQAWPTDITYRHDNRKTGGITDNWRKETAVYINEMAKQGRLIFLDDASQLHDEVMRTETLPGNPEMESTSTKNKGWKISGSWRDDHVLDAFMFVMWTILSQQLEVRGAGPKPDIPDPYIEEMNAFNAQRELDERAELQGYSGGTFSAADRERVYEKHMGRGSKGQRVPEPMRGHYRDY